MNKTAQQNERSQFLHWFGPLLDALRVLGGSGTPDEVTDEIAKSQGIPDEQLNESVPSGQQTRFKNQVAWARQYLKYEGLLGSSRRGVWSLSEKGLSTSLTIDDARAIRKKWVKIFTDKKKTQDEAQIPEEQITDEIEASPQGYRERLLAILRALPPEGFERLSQRLLRESGFVQVTVTGRAGDGGIDGHGTLQVNSLVSFRVLFQCKRYSGAVPPSQVRDFRGAMTGRTDKGIFITTGTFTAEARREASRDGAPQIELIDGEKLVDMFKELELGLSPLTTYEVEEQFFEEFKTSGQSGISSDKRPIITSTKRVQKV